jgi:hypothetical protein
VLDADPNCGLVGTFARILDSEGKVIGDVTPYREAGQIRRALLIRNQFVHSSVLVRKRTLDRAGWYDTSMPIWEDYELWLRIGRAAEFQNLPLPLTGYRRHAGNISNSVEEESIVSYWRIYRRYRKAYPHGFLLWLKAALLTCRFHLKHPVSGWQSVHAQ